MEIYEKTVKKIKSIEQEHAAHLEELRKDIDRLTLSAEEAEQQRMEAMKTGNQKLYSASVFALDQANTERKAKEQELKDAETGPIITKETAEALEADIMAGVIEKVRQTDKEFFRIIDEYFPKVEEASKAIAEGNTLMKKIELEMLKDERKIATYQRTGLPLDVKQIRADLTSLYYSNMIRRNGEYIKATGNRPNDQKVLQFN